MAMTVERLHPQDEAALAALFDDLRAEAPMPSGDFLRRVVADADAVGGERASAATVRPRPAAAPAVARFWSRVFATPFGRTAGGLVTAAVLGFGIGLSGALTGAPWLGHVAPLLFATDSDTALTLLPEADSFVIALTEETEAVE